MPGIYIHIPYCRQKCSYCNFYFLVSRKTQDLFLNALLQEIDLTKDYLDDKTINSIYLGGGTPSVLRIAEVSDILDRLRKIYTIDDNAEITLEANPDDINTEYVRGLIKSGINRISLGIQSFCDKELRLLNRSHDSVRAIDSIKICQDAGIDDLTIDLIFGIPGSSQPEWIKNLEIFLDLSIDHISCYNLTIEPKTAIAHQIKTRKTVAPDDGLNAKLFSDTIEILENAYYEHYEISNYARNGKYALHNTNYWKGVPYLGIGPSAHSFNIDSRRWNIANTRKYIESISQGILPTEFEILTTTDKYNEYIMTGLRTMWGIDDSKISGFGPDYYSYFREKVKEFIQSELIVSDGMNYRLTKKGKLLADRIASDLFL